MKRFAVCWESSFCSVWILMILAVLSYSCKKDEIVDPPLKDPRTYSWTRDTLAYPGSYQTAMRDIWATSATNVYVVGHNDQGGQGTMYHYDGIRWASTRFHISEGGPIRGAITFTSIYGFSASDIWCAGEGGLLSTDIYKGRLIHYDGSQWSEVFLPGARFLQDVWGSAPNDIWVSGWYGTLFHYDGMIWNRDSLPVVVPQGGFFAITRITGFGSTRYAFASTQENDIGRTTFYFFSRTQQSWTLADSFQISSTQSTYKWGAGNMWVSPQGKLYSVYMGVFRWEPPVWVTILPRPSTGLSLQAINGTSDQNIFAVGDFGKAFHYNGSDWYQYTELEDRNVHYSAVWTDGREAFIVGFTSSAPQKTIILHGK